MFCVCVEGLGRQLGKKEKIKKGRKGSFLFHQSNLSSHFSNVSTSSPMKITYRSLPRPSHFLPPVSLLPFIRLNYFWKVRACHFLHCASTERHTQRATNTSSLVCKQQTHPNSLVFSECCQQTTSRTVNWSSFDFYTPFSIICFLNWNTNFHPYRGAAGERVSFVASPISSRPLFSFFCCFLLSV